MENLIRIREPLAWALMVLAALTLAFQAVQIVWYLLESVQWYTVGGDTGGPSVSINWIFGWQGVDYALMLALVAVVAGCRVGPAVPRARTIALMTAWIASLTVALPWVVVGLSLLVAPSSALGSLQPWEWWMSVSLLHPLITSGVGVVAAIALWALARPSAAEDEVEDDGGDEPQSDDPAQLDGGEEEHPTVWKPAEATGTVWRTADEAAAGAPGARSLDSPKTAPMGAEWAHDAPQPDAGSSDDWRPPSAP